MQQDYRESDIVVRAVVTAQTIVADDEQNPAFLARWGEYSPVSLHRLRVVEVFKGRPGPTINLFQTIDSGRFAVDLGDELLIYLSYYPPAESRPSAARGAMYVRHACGQSKPWSETTEAEIASLRDLRGR